MILSWLRIPSTFCMLNWLEILRAVSKPLFPRQPLALKIIPPPGTLLKQHPNISYAWSTYLPPITHIPWYISQPWEYPPLGRDQWLSRACLYYLKSLNPNPVIWSCSLVFCKDVRKAKTGSLSPLVFLEQADGTLATHREIHLGIPSTSGGLDLEQWVYHFLPILGFPRWLSG